jgi:hypothetical protein
MVLVIEMVLQMRTLPTEMVWRVVLIVGERVAAAVVRLRLTWMVSMFWVAML